jgi:glutathione peroxidase
MQRILIIIFFLVFSSNILNGATKMKKIEHSIYDFKVTTIDGHVTTLKPYQHNVLLIVNVASFCTFTDQYSGLQTLYRKFKDRGFVVLGFPCNQFMNQEPNEEEDIKEFTEENYGVTFPLFRKIGVNGLKNTHPLFDYLKKEAPGIFGTESVKWNFTKFLIDRNGQVVDRFAPSTKPIDIEESIRKLL